MDQNGHIRNDQKNKNGQYKPIEKSQSTVISPSQKGLNGQNKIIKRKKRSNWIGKKVSKRAK